jgi:hypothetical protein
VQYQAGLLSSFGEERDFNVPTRKAVWRDRLQAIKNVIPPAIPGVNVDLGSINFSRSPPYSFDDPLVGAFDFLAVGINYGCGRE